MLKSNNNQRVYEISKLTQTDRFQGFNSLLAYLNAPWLEYFDTPKVLQIKVLKAVYYNSL